MSLIFFIKSSTVNIKNYTIKDIPGSSGRLDVISRCILAALLRNNDFEDNIQIWVFLEKLGTYIFDTKLLDYNSFPKNELKLTEYFVDLIRKKEEGTEIEDNPLNRVKSSYMTIFEALRYFLKIDAKAYILNENGEHSSNFLHKIKNNKMNFVFVIGDQSGNLIKSKGLRDMKLPNVCLGNKSYLASSIIRLIKLLVIY